MAKWFDGKNEELKNTWDHKWEAKLGVDYNEVEFAIGTLGDMEAQDLKSVGQASRGGKQSGPRRARAGQEVLHRVGPALA